MDLSGSRSIDDDARTSDVHTEYRRGAFLGSRMIMHCYCPLRRHGGRE